MSQFIESNSSSSSESATDASGSDSEDDFGVVGGPGEPYRFEPIAPEGYEEPAEDEDEDGLTPAILESRLEKEIPIDVCCRDELLSNATEFRCCKEIACATGKLVFDGIEAPCIMDHPDFSSLTNGTVLEQVCPLMKDKRGRSYKFPTNGSQNAKNESRRAIAYRFLVRWLFGPLGWDNTRPLPACIYHRLRTQFPSTATRGYLSANQQQ